MQNDGNGNITVPSLSISGVTAANAAKTFIADGTKLKINADLGTKFSGPIVSSADIISPYGTIDGWAIRSFGTCIVSDPTNGDGGMIGLGLGKNNGDRFYIRAVTDGIVFGQNAGIGDYTVHIKILRVNGQLYTSSDYRLKGNVRDIEEITTLNLRPVQYEMQENHRIGLIAHEVQEQIPYVVTGEKDGKEMQSVNYIDLIPVLIKDIQRLSKKNADLEERILRLESLLLDNSRTR